MAAERLHGYDTTVQVLAKGKTDTGRCWVYVRDDKPFGGAGPPAAMFYYSRDRRSEHPQSHLAGYRARKKIVAWLFCGSDRGGQRAAAMCSLIETAKMNGIDPQAWLADVLARVAGLSGQANPRLATLELAPTGSRRSSRLSGQPTAKITIPRGLHRMRT